MWTDLMIEDLDTDDKVTLDTYDTKTADDSEHDEKETVAEGTVVKKKYGITIESAEKDRAVQQDVDDEDRNFDRLDQESDDDSKDNPELSRDVSDKVAKQQVKQTLKAALAEYGKLPDLPKEPANDNHRAVVSWPLMDQLTRSKFEPDRERRTKFIVTARYLRELIDLAGADPMGADCDVQRSESGKVHFEHGQTLDRKKRTYDRKNDEQGADRFDGPLRTVKRSTAVDNSVDRDAPFAFRVVAAREELDPIRSHVGVMLWPLLVSSISENASFTDIGLKLGAKGGQAPPVGSAMIRLALTGAIDALRLLNGVKDEPPRYTPLPDMTHGSYWNQARGSVIKRAA